MIRRLVLLHPRTGKRCTLAYWTSNLRLYAVDEDLDMALMNFLGDTEPDGLGEGKCPVEDPSVLFHLAVETERE